MLRLRLSLQRFISFFLAGVPAAVLLLMLGGLYAADRVLVQGDVAQVQADAAQIAARVEQFVQTRVAVLRSFHGLFALPDTLSRRRAFSLLIEVATQQPAGFSRILATDPDRSIIVDTVIASSPAPSPLNAAAADLLVQSEVTLALADALTGRRVCLTSIMEITPGTYGFAVVSPVLRADTVIGIVLGTILRDTFLAELEATAGRNTNARARRQLVVTSVPLESGSGTAAREDTIGLIAQPRSARALAYRMAFADVPSGRRWKIEVAHAATGWPARLALWAIGLTALSALAVSSLRERDQSRRIAERSQELEHLSTELLHANRAKSEFLANVSHELRTPLNAIVGFVDLLRDGVYGELAPRQISPVDRIAASATHLRHLVDQVLDLAKIAAGRLEVHTDIVDLRAFVLAVASEMESLITERGLALSLGVGATLPRLRTDPTHLRQILVNLIGNAIKYTYVGTVAVRARLVGGTSGDRSPRATPEATWVQPLAPPGEGIWVAIQVMDTGIGIADVDQERIFDEFEQVGAGPRGDSMRRGTGLGLSISRRLARLLGGEIVVESQLGRGSTFTLWLPVDPADLKSVELRSSPLLPRVGDGVHGRAP